MNNKNVFKRIMEHLLVFISVGVAYFIIECLFKQRLSHWSMFLLSGAVGLIAMWLNDRFTYEMDYLLQILICVIVTTIAEYCIGITLNVDYSIWDYRELLFNLNGQICLLFSCIWAILFAILIPILDYVEWKVFCYKADTSPYYKIFGKKIFQFKG